MAKYLVSVVMIIVLLVGGVLIYRELVPPTTDPMRMAGHYHWLAMVDWNGDSYVGIDSVADGQDVVILLHPNDPLASYYYQHQLSFDDNGDGMIDHMDLIYSNLRVANFHHGNVLSVVPLSQAGIHSIYFDNSSPRIFSKVIMTGGDARIVKDDLLKQ